MNFGWESPSASPGSNSLILLLGVPLYKVEAMNELLWDHARDPGFERTFGNIKTSKGDV